MPDNSTSHEIDAAWCIISAGAEQGAYAGAVAVVAHHGQIVLERACGYAVLEPEQIPMSINTRFDLASLTKVVATLPAILRLVDQGAFGLDDPVANVLPAFTIDDSKRTITIRQLLSHTSGLPAWLPIYLDETGPEAYVAAIARAKLGVEPGTEVVYSDLGFILLGEIVRHVTGSDIATYAAHEIFTPLDMKTTEFRPPAWRRPEIAATERGNPREIEMTGDRASQYSHWRQEIIWGSVHDGNAYYGLNGVAGHAGLFGTAADILRYGQCWLHHGRREETMLLSPEVVAEATREQAPGRRLGWRLPAPVDDQDDLIRPLGAGAYGHTGFTGTALWVAPALDLVAVLLTNRVHPLSREEISTIRPAFAAALAKAVAS
jgi:CubicO group peptidase (beta-lactamase class C family)